MAAKNHYYCYDCLRKFTIKRSDAADVECCPDCKCLLRRVKNSRTRAQTVTRLARQRGVKPKTKRVSEYELYLQSQEWRDIRYRVLVRDCFACRCCGAAAAQVHHLSYSAAVMAGEDDSQLMSLCRKCHEDKHHDKVKKIRRKILASDK